MHNIYKSGFHAGEYVGHGQGTVWKIRKMPHAAGWKAIPRDADYVKNKALKVHYAKTLKEMSKLIDNAASRDAPRTVGRCQACNKSKRLNAQGKIGSHRYQGSLTDCRGSGRSPVKTVLRSGDAKHPKGREFAIVTWPGNGVRHDRLQAHLYNSKGNVVATLEGPSVDEYKSTHNERAALRKKAHTAWPNAKELAYSSAASAGYPRQRNARRSR